MCVCVCVCVCVCAGYIKRVIVHPAFFNASFKEAEKELAKMDLGEAIFRPSSKVRHTLSSSSDICI